MPTTTKSAETMGIFPTILIPSRHEFQKRVQNALLESLLRKAGGQGWEGIDTNVIKKPATKYEAISNSTTLLSPSTPNRIPPKGGPMRRASVLLSALRELAVSKRSSLTRWGSRAFSAGPKNVEIAASTNIAM